MRRARVLRALLALAGAMILVAGCGDTAAPTGPIEGPPLAPQTVASPGTPTATRIEISIQKGRVAGDGEVTVDAGDTVTLVVTADVDDEVHVHGYDVMQDVAADVPTTITFTADAPGIFEVELEDAGLPIAEITVRP